MATGPTAEEFSAVTEKLERMTDALSRATGQTTSFGQAAIRAFNQLETGVTGFATAMADGKQGASAFNGVINSSKDALGTMLKEAGLLGTAFSKVTDFAAAYVIRANQQGDALFKSFQDLSRVGGASAEGMDAVSGNMKKFGLTLDAQLPEFTAMLIKNSEALAQLGGTVNQGIKTFANVSAGIQQTGLQAEFERMGLKTKDINDGTVNYLRIQAMNAANSAKSTAELTAGAAEYIRQQDRLSRLTGKSADVLAKEQEDRMKDQRFRAYTREQDQKQADLRATGTAESIAQADAMAAQQEETTALLGNLQGDMKKAAQDMISGGTVAGSKEAQQMFKLMPELSQKLMSGTAGLKDLQKGAQEARTQLNQFGGLAKVSGFDQVFGKFYEYADFEAKQLALKKTGVDTPKQDATELKEGKNKDINNQVALRQAQTATTMAMDDLVKKGISPVTAGMLKLATGIEKVITAIPGVGEKTSTRARPGESGSGRGVNAPATAGYGTDFKPEDLTTFLEETINKAFKSLTGPDTLTPTRPPVTTSTQAHDVLSRGPRQTGPSTTMSSEQANNILQRAAGPNTNYRTNLGDTTLATERTASTTQESAAGGSADLTQGLMTLAQNIGLQTSSMNELVGLMRQSNGIQDKILQQARN